MDKTKLSVFILIAFFHSFVGCIQQEDNLVYAPGNEDPWSSNRNVASLDSINPFSEYPTFPTTIYGSNFDIRSEENNFVWFGVSRAQVTGVWSESLRVEVPPIQPPLYFFSDTVDVKVGLQGSFDWSNLASFVYKPMAHMYTPSSYPEDGRHPEDKFTEPRGLAFDTENNLYLMNARLRSIYKDEPAGGNRTVFAFLGKFDGGLRLGPDGYFYAAGNSDGVIYKITPDGSEYEEWVSVPSPWGLDFDSDGNIFVVDNTQSDIYKVEVDKNVKKFADFDPDLKIAYCKVYNEEIYINAESEGQIYKFPVSGDSITSIDTIKVTSANVISDMVFDQQGNMYFSGGTDISNEVLVLHSSGFDESLVTFGVNKLSFIVTDEKFLYISNLDGPVYKVLILR